MIKPVSGIENCKFRPIVRSVDHLQLNLTPIEIKLAKYTVQKMLRDIQPKSALDININQGGGQLNSRFATTPEANMQQSSAIKLGSRQENSNKVNKRGITRSKLKEIIKFENVIKKFCEKIGIDKRTVLNILNPREKEVMTPESDFVSMTLKNGRPSSDQLQNQQQIDTGKAAMLAYTNLEDSKMDEKPPAEWRRGPNTRNQSQGVKSIGDGKTPNSDNLQP